ncbi:MAG TPA: ribbon-helix-helix protein, CopG family [Solirubrobacterales bacterium]
MTAAVRAYLAGVREHEAEWRVPAALAEFDAAGPELSTELRLDPTELEGLDAEAARQDVSRERLVEQAVIVAYAELDRRRA